MAADGPGALQVCVWLQELVDALLLRRSSKAPGISGSGWEKRNWLGRSTPSSIATEFCPRNNLSLCSQWASCRAKSRQEEINGIENRVFRFRGQQFPSKMATNYPETRRTREIGVGLQYRSRRGSKMAEVKKPLCGGGRKIQLEIEREKKVKNPREDITGTKLTRRPRQLKAFQKLESSIKISSRGGERHGNDG